MLRKMSQEYNTIFDIILVSDSFRGRGGDIRDYQFVHEAVSVIRYMFAIGSVC